MKEREHRTRRDFLTGGACAFTTALALPRVAVAAGGTPLLKIGIVSDSQGYPYAADWGYSHLARAFEGLAAEGIDVLVNAGDIADTPDGVKASLAYVQAMERRIFGAAKPVDIACLGNHELGFALAKDPAAARAVVRDFCDVYGYPDAQLQHVTVRGFDFISYSCLEDRHYDASALAEIEAALEKAVARDATRPIFVVTHFHPADTVAGSSDIAGETGRALRALFNRYPQVVSLSGHSHTPLQDGTCFWQGEFTALETSTVCYGCIEGDYANLCSCIIPWARESVGYQIASVYSDRIVVRRYQAYERKEILPGRPWTIPLPHRPAPAEMFRAKRKAEEVAPRFRKGAQCFLRYDYGYIYFVLDPAEHPDFVHHYRFELTELNAAGEAVAVPQSWNYLADFYRYSSMAGGRQCFRNAPKMMKSGVTYRVRVYPVANFGTEGAPLELTVAVRASYRIREDCVLYPQE